MKKLLAQISIFFLPFYVYGAETVNSVETLAKTVTGILNNILPIIISIAVIWFIYNVFIYMIAGDEEKKASSKSNMIYGIVALFVMVSVWGLVAIISGSLGFKGDQIVPPQEIGKILDF